MLEEKEVSQYYIAKKELLPFTEVTLDDFIKIEIEKGKEPQGAVVNFANFNGKFAKGTIYKGDILMEERLVDEVDNKDNIYTIEIISDYSGPLKYDDIVDVYTLSNVGVVQLLFDNKKLIAPDGMVLANNNETTEDKNSIDKKFIRVSKQEMLNYYSRINKYEFIIIPVGSEFLGSNAASVVTGEGENTELTKDGIKEALVTKHDSLYGKESRGIALSSVTAGEEETHTVTITATNADSYESIAADWGLTVDELKDINPNVSQVYEGAEINLCSDVSLSEIQIKLLG